MNLVYRNNLLVYIFLHNGLWGIGSQEVGVQGGIAYEALRFGSIHMALKGHHLQFSAFPQIQCRIRDCATGRRILFARQQWICTASLRI